MAMIDWKESFSVGVAELDEQHKGLLQIINNLSEIKRHHPDSKVLYKALNSLIQYAQNHFSTEEKLMEEHGFPGLAEQQKEHDAFTGKIFVLNAALARGDTGLKKRGFHKRFFCIHWGMQGRGSLFFIDPAATAML